MTTPTATASNPAKTRPETIAGAGTLPTPGWAVGSTQPVTLPGGNDAAVATKIKELIPQAESGLKAMILLGLLLDEVKRQVGHGNFEPWIEQHVGQPPRTVLRWRNMAATVTEWVRTQLEAQGPVDFHHLLTAPAKRLAPELALVRTRLDDEIAKAGSVRQLTLALRFGRGGDLTPRDETGKLKRSARSTKAEATRARFEASARAWADDLTVLLAAGLDEEFDGLRYWDALKDGELETLAGRLADIRRGILATQQSRAAIKKGKK